MGGMGVSSKSAQVPLPRPCSPPHSQLPEHPVHVSVTHQAHSRGCPPAVCAPPPRPQGAQASLAG